MHNAQNCGCGGNGQAATLVPYNQYPDVPIRMGSADKQNFPWPYIVNQTPYYQSFWAGNQLPSTRHNLAHARPYAVARADFFQQVQLSKGMPPLSAPAGAVQSFVRRMSAAWSASYGR